MDYKDKCKCFTAYMERTSDLAIDAYKYKLMAEHCTNQVQRTEFHSMHEKLMELYHKEIANITEHMM